MARRGTVSNLRLEARAVIAATLQALPEDADLAAKRQALKAAFCFSHLCHRGRYAWEAECSPHLRPPKPPKVWPDRTVFVLEAATTNPGLRVECCWCGSKERWVSDGTLTGRVRAVVPCMMCAGHWELLAVVVSLPMWHALQQAVRDGDETARLAIVDWLIEHGIDTTGNAAKEK